MAGYTRTDVTGQIADGNTINAAPINQEFDALESAFDVLTGHKHDGTANEGSPITVIGPTQDIVATASVLRPKTDNVVDLGTSTLEFKDLWIDGTANIDSLSADTITSGNILPLATLTYDIGSSSVRWNRLYTDNITDSGVSVTITGGFTVNTIAQFNNIVNFNSIASFPSGSTANFDGTVNFEDASFVIFGGTGLDSTRASLIVPKTPQTGSGLGQFVVLSAASNTNLILPAGGSWLWWIIQRNSSTFVVNDVSTGISAGSSIIFTATAGVDTRGWAWRIA